MIILKSKNNIYRKANATFLMIVLILTSMSTILLFTTPVKACYTVGTFESDYIIPDYSFLQGEIVYGKGTDTFSGHFKLRIRDPEDNVVYNSNPVYGTEVTCSYSLDEEAPIGEWDIQLGVFYEGSWQWSTESGRISNFNVLALTEYTLTINIDGNGNVNKNPDQTTYTEGTSVQLTANPETGWIFSHWSGDLNSNSNPVTIDMNGNKDVTAHFEILNHNEGNGDNGNGGDEKIPTSYIKPNEPPVADLSAGELYIGLINEEIIFNGTLSYDDGYIIEWLWDFGDGTTALGEITTHNYTNPGNYTVVLKVTDNMGATHTDESIVTAIQPNRPPSEPNISGPSEGFVKVEYTFSIFSTDEDDDKIQYIIDWGDGTSNESDFLPLGELFNISHKWIMPGEYIINVSANDNDASSKLTDFKIIIDEQDIPEESNIMLIFILLIIVLLLLVFFILFKIKKNKK